jgi:hypothetical protein
LILSVIETAFYLAGNAVLYARDGYTRFIHGFGAESNFTEHVIVVVLRIVLIAYLFVVSLRRVMGRADARTA